MSSKPIHPAPSFVILLVEDDADHAELVSRGLEDQHLPVLLNHVWDGEAALDYLWQRGPYADSAASPRPNLILLDLRLPKIDGLQVLKELKATTELRHIATVILTTSAADRDISLARQAGADGYLVKPVDFDKIRHLLAAPRPDPRPRRSPPSPAGPG